MSITGLPTSTYPLALLHYHCMFFNHIFNDCCVQLFKLKFNHISFCVIQHDVRCVLRIHFCLVILVLFLIQLNVEALLKLETFSTVRGHSSVT